MPLTDIALFPIPRCVSFPGTIYPLHVFEPRYRAMVKHCLESKTQLAVCHTQKVLHPAKEHQTREEALQSNQATYKPYNVFSAGPCELKETLDDGRMLIHVQLEKRYRAIREKQTLPFSIYECEEFLDNPHSDTDRNKAKQLQDKILHRLIAITAAEPRVQALLKSEQWQQKDPTDFSFELFGLLHLEAELLQHILESPSPVERLDLALQALNQHV